MPSKAAKKAVRKAPRCEKVVIKSGKKPSFPFVLWEKGGYRVVVVQKDPKPTELSHYEIYVESGGEKDSMGNPRWEKVFSTGLPLTGEGRKVFYFPQGNPRSLEDMVRVLIEEKLAEIVLPMHIITTKGGIRMKQPVGKKEHICDEGHWGEDY